MFLLKKDCDLSYFMKEWRSGAAVEDPAPHTAHPYVYVLRLFILLGARDLSSTDLGGAQLCPPNLQIYATEYGLRY